MEPTCCIFAAGDYCGAPEISKKDLVIAADAGLNHLNRLGITPDVVLGDFDSLGGVPENANVLRFPPEKDCTDTYLALQEGLTRGFKRFTVCGALGGKRLEHTLANLQNAAYFAENGCEVYLTDGSCVITVLHNSSFRFSGAETGFISVFSLSETSRGVTLSGLKYPLENAVLSCSVPLGVSNEFTEKTAEISVKNGTIAVLWYV